MYMGSPDGILRPLMVPVTQSLPIQLSMRHGRKVPRRQRNQRVLHYGLYQNKNRGHHGHRVGYTSSSPHFGSVCSPWQYEGGGLRKEDASGYRLNADRQFVSPTGTDSYLPLLENHTVVNSFPAHHISSQAGHYGYPTEIIPQTHAYQSQMGQRYYYQKPTLNQELYHHPFPNDLFFDSRFVHCNEHTQAQFYHSQINEPYMVEEKPYSSESTDSVLCESTEKIAVADFEPASYQNAERDNPDVTASAIEVSSHEKGQCHPNDRPESGGEAMAETISNALISTVLGNGSFFRTDEVIGQFTEFRQELSELVSSTIQAKKTLEENQFRLVKEEEKKQERIASSSRNLQSVSTLNGPSLRYLPLDRSGGVGVRRSRRILERSSRATVSFGTDYDMDEISEDEREAHVSSKKPANVNNNSIFWVKVHPSGCMPINRFMW